MKKPSELPRAINNLRAIWEQKKVEMQFTQVEAAKKLGWTQGAISHYLNNLTVLGPAAAIKFANFLGVDPLEIDPTITEFLPSVRTRLIKYDADNLSKAVNRPVHDVNPASSFWVKTCPATFTYLPYQLIEDSVLDADLSEAQFEWYTLVCTVADHPRANTFMIQLKGQKDAKIYKKHNLPPANRIAKKFAVLETEISNSVAT